VTTRVPLRRLENRINDELTRRDRLRTLLALVMSACGGLAVLYVFFALVATVDLGRAGAATVIALALASVWVVGFWHRARIGATRVQRHHSERRGF
jgi:hypothetical protein